MEEDDSLTRGGNLLTPFTFLKEGPAASEGPGRIEKAAMIAEIL
jgi:hypothetical protein